MKGICALFCLFALSAAVYADALNVAVAANFRPAAQRIADEFVSATGQEVQIISGSTGKLYAQVVNGAPFHVFLGADQCAAIRLATNNAAAQDTRVSYAVGRLAYWSRAMPTTSEPDWPEIRRLAFANPSVAPYGLAARDVIDNRAVQIGAMRTVMGESVAQVYQFIASGAVDGGFVAWSQLRASAQPEAEHYWLVPESLHRPIVQDAVVTRHGEDHPAALAFMRFLTGGEARSILVAHGYAVPTSQTASLSPLCH